MSGVRVDIEGPVTIVTIDRPGVRNAVDPPTAAELVHAFETFDRDDDQSVAILTGAGGTFCAGADLKALAAGDAPLTADDGPSPMGPVRELLGKPVLAAIEGYAVGGGLELALWCDLRIAARDAVLGVFNRRLGVPLVDLGSVRLPRLIGHSRALDLILTGRAVGAEEAERIGLVNRVVEPGLTLESALRLGRELAAFPQAGLRSDRLSTYEQWSLPFDAAIRNELRRALEVIGSGETAKGAERFTRGAGRHGEPLMP
jgi:enoyl-CoA hydratase